MTASVLMVQGTASSVGKSIVVAGLCRLFRQEGLSVAPFKAQNMALNAAVTPDGLEIGRSTAVQAAAAGIAPSVEMNPILIKPEAGARAQIVVLGKPLGSLETADYLSRKAALWEVVAGALAQLRSHYDLVVIEGAGSPAEVNLRDGDVVNMRVARHASAPVLLVGDIDRGGVFAALIGTLDLLLPEERDLVRGLIINRFRGKLDLLRPGLSFLENRTGKPVLGVLPFLEGLRIADEDAVALDERADRRPADAGPLDIAVVRLPRISNFDDFDLLAAEPAVSLRYVERLDDLGRPDLLILPGSKSTVADLAYLRKTGFADGIRYLAALKTPILGICGGYQMLGQRILDPDRVESGAPEAPGLGLLPVTTCFQAEKRTRSVRARGLPGPGWFGRLVEQEFSGYEIHQGQSIADGLPALEIVDGDARRTDGCQSSDGLVVGTYLHGIFEGAIVRDALIQWLGERKGLRLRADPGVGRTRDYDRLADWLRENLDLRQLYQLAGVPRLPDHATTEPARR